MRHHKKRKYGSRHEDVCILFEIMKHVGKDLRTFIRQLAAELHALIWLMLIGDSNCCIFLKVDNGNIENRG